MNNAYRTEPALLDYVAQLVEQIDAGTLVVGHQSLPILISLKDKLDILLKDDRLNLHAHNINNRGFHDVRH